MFAETVLRLNYVVSFHLYLFADKLRKKYSTNCKNLRKGIKYIESCNFKICNRICPEKEIENILRESDSLYENGLYDECFRMLNQIQDMENPQILWRHGRLLYRYAMAANDKAEKRKAITEALSKLQDAVQRDENCHFIHVWLSVFLLSHAQACGYTSNVFQYINRGHMHMRQAIQLAPDEPLVWFTLACFEYNLADLPWLQRKLVLAALSVKPAGTYEKALEYFKKAEKLKPGFCALNQLMIAKCLIALNNAADAEFYLTRLVNRKVRNEDDKTSNESAQKLLQILTKRREGEKSHC